MRMVDDGTFTLGEWLVEQMLHCMGVDYTHSFMNNMVARYRISNSNIMRMYSAVYVGRKTKLEREFYFGYIQAWVKDDKDEYLAAVGKMGGEWRRKVLAALRKAELIEWKILKAIPCRYGFRLCLLENETTFSK